MSSSSNERNLKSKVTGAMSFYARHQAGLLGLSSAGGAIEQATTGNFTIAAFLGGVSVVGLGLEGTQQFLVRANNRMASARQLTPDSEELKKFRTEPNPAIDLLEEYLGLSFERTPVKVEYNFRNSRVHRRIDPLDASLTRHYFKKRSVGIYEPRYNIYFAEVGTDIMTDLHESAHGLIHQFNPEFVEIDQRYNNAASEGESLPDEDVEKYLTCQAFNEGMAKWMEFSTVLQHFGKHIENDEIRKSLWTTIVMNVDEGIFTISDDLDKWPPFYLTPFLDEDRETLMQANGLYNQALLLKGGNILTFKKQSALRQKANDLLVKPKYRIGANFVSNGVRVLEEAGLDLPDALVALIQNPPSTIDELLDPQRYVREKLLSKED